MPSSVSVGIHVPSVSVAPLDSGEAYAEFFRQVEALGLDGALRRAGTMADGWIMSPFGTVRDFPRLWRVVQDAARAAGRNPDTLVAGRFVYVAVDDDRDRARESLRAFLHGYYGARFDVDRHAIFGPPAEVAARLVEHVQAGITKLMLGVPSLDLAHLRRVAREVAPLVRANAAIAR